MKFKECNDGVYYFYIKSNKLEDAPAVFSIQSLLSATDYIITKDNINPPVTNYYVAFSFLHTVADNNFFLFQANWRRYS